MPKVNVYAEELETNTLTIKVKEKERDGVRYYGVEFDTGVHQGVTLWFTSKTRMYEVMNDAASLAFGI